jgi:hypothetical protein
MLGWKQADMVGEAIYEFALLPADEFERDELLIARREQLLTRGQLQATTRLVSRTGEQISYAYTASRVSPVHFVAVGDLVRTAASIQVAPHDWLTKPEAADYCRCSEATIERLMHDGLLPRNGGLPGKRMFRRSWLDKLLGGGTLLLLVLVAVLVLAAGSHHVRGRLGRLPIGRVTLHKHAKPVAAPARRSRLSTQQHAQQQEEREQHDHAGDADRDLGRGAHGSGGSSVFQRRRPQRVH